MILFSAYVDKIYANPCEVFIKSDTCENGAQCEVKDGFPFCKWDIFYIIVIYKKNDFLKFLCCLL